MTDGNPVARQSSVADRALGIVGYCHARPVLWRLGLTAAIVIAATTIRLALLGALDGRLAYVTFYPAVAIAAIVGGLPAGALATVLAALFAHGLFAPIHNVADVIGLVAFLVSCSIVVGMAEAMRVLQSRLVVAERYRQSEQHLSRFVERVPAAIAMFDREMRYLASSARWRSDFGLGGDVVGHLHYELLPEISDRWKAIHRRGLAGDIIGADDDMFTRLDGSRQWLRWEMRPWHEGAEVGGIIIYSEDLTERKLLEERLKQSEQLEMIGRLSGGVAHDFNNLLTVIIGNAELLSEQLGLRSDLRQLAGNICSAGDRGAELTQQLLAFGRRQLLNPSPFDLNQLVEVVCRLARPTMAGIVVATDLDPKLAPIFADYARMEAALLNLMLNAQDAMNGQGRLTIATSAASIEEGRAEMAPGDYVLITIADEGVGMTEKVRAQAFDPFFSTKEFGRSSGLGLSMVYGFAKQSKGHVLIESEQGQGTKVRMYLPRASSQANASPQTITSLHSGAAL
jgi:PAS domain S-box-containing protein